MKSRYRNHIANQHIALATRMINYSKLELDCNQRGISHDSKVRESERFDIAINVCGFALLSCLDSGIYPRYMEIKIRACIAQINMFFKLDDEDKLVYNTDKAAKNGL